MNAQKEVLNESKMTVISPKGINIYTKPDIHSKKIGSLPYGAKIKVKYDWEAEKDTIGSHKYWSQSYAFDIPIIGKWQKLSSQSKKGYVIDAYLDGLPDVYPQFKNKNLNQNHIILFPGSNCANNFQYNPNLNWFGFYQIDNQLIVKPVDLIFFNTADRMSGRNICAVDYKNLKFIYGTEADLNSVISDNGKYNDGYESFDIDDYPELNKSGCSISITQNGKIQNLYSNHGCVNFVRWKGDLDNDGQDDYIIDFGEVEALRMLFLSSEAKGDELLRAVAFFMTPYCC